MTVKKPDKVKRYPLKPYSRAWNKEALEKRLLYAPHVYDCMHCGAPVIEGYYCTYCSSENPR